MALVLGLAVAAVLTLVTGAAAVRQVQLSADRRLSDGAMAVRPLLDSSRGDLSIAADGLVHDPGLLTPLQADNFVAVQAYLAATPRASFVDEALIASSSGVVAAYRSTGAALQPDDALADGLRRALAGQGFAGLDNVGGRLQQVVYAPARAVAGGPPVGAVRLARAIDAQELDRFKASSGLDVSLSLGGAWAATTLAGSGGTPLSGLQADPATVRAVVGRGQSRYAYWNLLAGGVRSYSVPLTGASGNRIGMLSVTLPVASLETQYLEAFLAALPLVGLVALIVAGLAYYLLRRLQRPVRALVGAAARLRSGDFTTPVPVITEPALALLSQELELARSRLQESLQIAAVEEAHLRAIFFALPQPVLVTSLDGRISDCNPAALTFFGGEDDFLRQPIQRLLPGVQPRQGGEGPAVAWRGSLHTMHGEAVDVEVLRARLAGGRLPARDIYVVHDVSSLAEINRLREQLLYNVAHELRTPLGMLENLFQILEDDYLNLNLVEVDRLLGSGRRTAARIRRLMEDLLSAGSIESGHFSIRCQRARVAAIIDDGIEAIEGMINERRQQVAVAVSPPELCALADPGHASRVVANLVSNASKYGPEDEVIRVTAQLAGGYVRVTVEDRGPGVPADQHLQMFDRFFRLGSPSKAPGIGLGLAIARGIVELHGGAIGIESGEQLGARVWFTLPAMEIDVEAPGGR